MFTPHSKGQDEAIFSDKPINVAATGIQYGKTTIGTLWLKRMCHTFTGKDDNFLMVAPNYKIMQQSCLPAFLKIMTGCGVYKSADSEFKINGGGTVYMRTGTDPDSVVGITNVRAIYGDEAGLYSLYFYENLEGRAAFKAAPMMLTTSPYTLNWLYKQIILPHMKGQLDSSQYHILQAASWDNPYFNMEYLKKKKETMDPVRFNMMFGGQWARMNGLVYAIFDEDENQMDETLFPPGTRFFAGVDWGYTHPAHIGVRAITPQGDHWKITEFHKAGQTLPDMVSHAKQLRNVWPIECFFCGPDQPGSIEEFNRNGLPAIAANNDVRLGIDKHYELIKTRRFKLWRGQCPHTLSELDTYHYPEPKDLKPDQDDKDQMPVKQDDDAMDSDRYCSIMTYDLKGLQPLLPKTIDPRQKELQKLFKVEKNTHTERW